MTPKQKLALFTLLFPAHLPPGCWWWVDDPLWPTAAQSLERVRGRSSATPAYGTHPVPPWGTARREPPSPR